jgi:hypothetical protein
VVAQNFDVGEAGAVIDRDVHVLPAGYLTIDPSGVDSAGTTASVGHADDAGAGAALDPPQLLDVDVDQLAGTSSRS